ncbi:MAG: DUF1565 domain-containing protein [Planctomycetes bacterium]|nr:DUF1565 domain-containing protein [Planctomycetota bacterium]
MSKSLFALVPLLLIVMASALGCGPAAITTRHVAVTGNDTPAGTANRPLATIDAAMRIAAPGDTVIVADGTYTEWLRTYAEGTKAAPITLKAQNPRGAVVTHPGGRVLTIDRPFYIVEGLVFDGQYGEGNIVEIFVRADNTIFRNNVVRRGGADGIDLGNNFGKTEGPNDVLIEDCLIHDMLRKRRGRRVDAHGIVTGGVLNLTIRDTEVRYVSGDSLQVQDGGWRNVLVDRCTFWSGPLPEERNGFAKGVNPGENAIDTKQDPNQTGQTSKIRSTIFIRNSVFYGWKDTIISFPSALNLKEKIEAVVDGCTLYDNHVALRLRCRPNDNGAHVTVKNCVLYGNRIALRYERRIKPLIVYNNTFAQNDKTFQKSAHRNPYLPENAVLNNLFLGEKPQVEARHDSNVVVGIEDFFDPSAGDYRLRASSRAIDAGVDLRDKGVTTDRNFEPRPKGSAYDAGAYESR